MHTIKHFYNGYKCIIVIVLLFRRLQIAHRNDGLGRKGILGGIQPLPVERRIKQVQPARARLQVCNAVDDWVNGTSIIKNM